MWPAGVEAVRLRSHPSLSARYAKRPAWGVSRIWRREPQTQFLMTERVQCFALRQRRHRRSCRHPAFASDRSAGRSAFRRRPLRAQFEVGYEHCSETACRTFAGLFPLCSAGAQSLQQDVSANGSGYARWACGVLTGGALQICWRGGGAVSRAAQRRYSRIISRPRWIRLFTASRVRRRACAISVMEYSSKSRSTIASRYLSGRD